MLVEKNKIWKNNLGNSAVESSRTSAMERFFAKIVNRNTSGFWVLNTHLGKTSDVPSSRSVSNETSISLEVEEWVINHHQLLKSVRSRCRKYSHQSSAITIGAESEQGNMNML